jgi:hypothetical protein
VAVRTLRLPGAEDTGPSVAAMHEARETQDDNELERSLFEGLAEDVRPGVQVFAAGTGAPAETAPLGEAPAAGGCFSEA